MSLDDRLADLEAGVRDMFAVVRAEVAAVHAENAILTARLDELRAVTGRLAPAPAPVVVETPAPRVVEGPPGFVRTYVRPARPRRCAGPCGAVFVTNTTRKYCGPCLKDRRVEMAATMNTVKQARYWRHAASGVARAG